jgi:hypothetical protein
MIMKPPEAAPKDCMPQESYISNVVLAHAYVPFQKLCNTFSPIGSLTRGTAFPPLYETYQWDPKRMRVTDDE